MSSRIPTLNFTTLPLIKFSHHTGPYGTRSHTWTHINHRNDLNFVLRDVRLIDDFGNHNTRRWMKVTSGFEILESQDLSQLVNFSQEHSSSSRTEHPIEIVVKAPFLAMKYPKTAVTVRRIQVKFQKETDFVLAVTMLKNIGLSVLDKDSSPKAPITYPSSSPVKACVSASSSGLSFPRPSSTGHVSFQENSGIHGISMTSPIKSSLNTIFRPHSTASEYNRNVSEPSHLSRYPDRPFSANSSLPTFISGPSSSGLPSFYDSTIHSTADYFSQIEAENRHMSQSTQSNPPRFDNFKPSANDVHFLSMSQPLSNKIVDQSNEVSDLPIISPYFQPQPDAGTTSKVQIVDLLTDQKLETDMDRFEPVSNVIEHTESHNLWIPPKRELPFSRPQSKVRSYSSPFKDFPPLPKPTPVTKENLDNSGNKVPENPAQGSHEKKHPQKKRVPLKKKPTDPVDTSKKEDASSSLVSVLAKENTKSSPVKKRIASRPASAPSKSQPRRVAPARKQITSVSSLSSKDEQPKMIDQGTQTQSMPNQEYSSSKELTSSKDEVSTNASSPKPPPQGYLSLIDDFVTKHKARPSPRELWETPEYINTDEKTRRSLVNNFICENLENKDFLQLCEDVECSWQRIGIGLST